MEEAVIEAVQQSWRRAAAVGPLFAGLVLVNLQCINPAIQTSQHGQTQDMLEHKLMHELNALVHELQDEAQVRLHLREIKSAFAYGNHLTQFLQDVWGAILVALEQVLGLDLTAQIRQAWWQANDELIRVENQTVV